MKKFKLLTIISLLFSVQIFAIDVKSNTMSDDKYTDRVADKSQPKDDKKIEKAGCLTIKDGKIKYLDGKKEVIINESYCYDSVLKSISSVRKCADKNDIEKECLINMPGPFEMKLKDVQSEMGSIGFNICNKLNGTPQIIDYWDGSSWIKTSRCIFTDTSYMDISELSMKVKYVD